MELEQITSVSIIGSGTWGTALANLLAHKGIKTILCSKFAKDAVYLKEKLRHPNLPGAVLDSSIIFTSDLEYSVKASKILVLACPSIYVRDMANEMKPYFSEDQIIVNVSKGIEEETLFTMSEVIRDVLGRDTHVVVLSGPSHAEEVSVGLPTLITAASEVREDRKLVQKVFSNEYFRVYSNGDPKGVEIAAAFKNIIALACGIADGLGFGDNAKAAIVTRGLFEIMKLGQAMYCDPRTFSGLSGLGDIVVTSFSHHSRNHNAGVLFGQGIEYEEVLQRIGMVVEGVNSLKGAIKYANKFCIEMPIIFAVNDIVYNGKDPRVAVNELFDRELVGEKK